MNKSQKIVLFILRLSMGWVMFYAGITKILNPEWSAAGYLQNAKTFSGFYHLFLTPGILPVVNFLNEWGLTFLGVSLILGIFVRLSSILGAILMLLYYFPVLTFPYILPNSFLIDDHIIYALILVFFAVSRVGQFYGLDKWCRQLPLCRRFPRLYKWLAG